MLVPNKIIGVYEKTVVSCLKNMTFGLMSLHNQALSIGVTPNLLSRYIL
jgi:hypothetical protein